MRKHYIAVTYDICEHNDLCEDMNMYYLESTHNIDEQIRNFAKTDISPLIKVYKSATDDYTELEFYKEYKFKEYECDCQ